MCKSRVTGVSESRVPRPGRKCSMCEGERLVIIVARGLLLVVVVVVVVVTGRVSVGAAEVHM